MFNLSYFERLVETVTVIFRHPDYPNKEWAVERCRYEIAELNLTGRITVAEAKVLVKILDEGPESGYEGGWAMPRRCVGVGCRPAS